MIAARLAAAEDAVVDAQCTAAVQFAAPWRGLARTVDGSTTPAAYMGAIFARVLATGAALLREQSMKHVPVCSAPWTKRPKGCCMVHGIR